MNDNDKEVQRKHLDKVLMQDFNKSKKEKKSDESLNQDHTNHTSQLKTFENYFD